MPRTKEKSTFSRFFREDAEVVHDLVFSGPDRPSTTAEGGARKEVLASIVKPPEEKDEDAVRESWKQLRAFFRNANNENGLPKDWRPALLAPLYTKDLVGVEFPVWVGGPESNAEPGCQPLHTLLSGLIMEIAPEKEEAHILKENLDRITHIANDRMADGAAQSVRDAVNVVLDELERQLDVSGDELLPFRSDMQKLRAALPDAGKLVPYSRITALELLESAMAATTGHSRNRLKTEIRMLRGKLKDLLQMECEKDPARQQPGALQDTMDFAEEFVDFDRLSSLLPKAGTLRMNEARIRRIESALEGLEHFESLEKELPFLFIDEFLYEHKGIRWEELLATDMVTVFPEGTGCDALAGAFREHIAPWVDLYRARRIGELELNNNYQENVHDEFFRHFGWQSFTRDELNSCSYFLLIADDVRLFEAEFSKLSKLLSANLPVKVVAVKRDSNVDDDAAGAVERGSAWHANTELGALMLSYKNIYISQSSSITPTDLYRSFEEGLSAFAPAFFYLMNADADTRGNAYLATSSSMESRDFPGFTYRGLLGTPWGSRFDISNNPQQEMAWPVHTFPVLDGSGRRINMDFTFTFSDHAAANPAYHHHFLPVDPACWNDDLITLPEYIDNHAGRYSNGDALFGENIGKIPYIWMMDGTGQLHKVAISWQMVLASQERLDFWRFLQENCGINNYHVALATQQAREEMQRELDAAVDSIQRLHAEELERVRDEEAGKVMENLTSVLLDLDTSHLSMDPVSIRAAASAARPGEPSASELNEVRNDTDTSEETADGALETEDELVLSTEPYIDTALCTSCNECTQLNGTMFRYNSDKMAYINDATAGTFRELVEAAEKCPVSIIHPGAPLNPDEPGLEDLMARAQKFN